MIRLLIFGILVFSSCQDKIFIKNKCDLFDVIINNKVVQQEFFVCKDQKQSFVIYDKYNLLTNCSEKSICNSDFSIGIKKPIVKKNKGNIEIYNFVKGKDTLEIYLYRPYSGAAVILTLKVNTKNTGWLVIEEGIGTF